MRNTTTNLYFVLMCSPEKSLFKVQTPLGPFSPSRTCSTHASAFPRLSDVLNLLLRGGPCCQGLLLCLCEQSHRRALALGLAKRTETRSRFISHSPRVLWLTLHECICAIVQNRPSKSHSSFKNLPPCSSSSVAPGGGRFVMGGGSGQKCSSSLFFFALQRKEKWPSHKKKDDKHIKSIYVNWSLDSVALYHKPSQNGRRRMRVYLFPIAANNLRGSRYMAKTSRLDDICVLSSSN